MVCFNMFEDKKIIAFSGKKEGGKTTAVDKLTERWGGPLKVLHMSFAGELKRIVRKCFVPSDWNLNFDSDEDKSKVLPCGRTLREMLQLVGTDWFRTVYPDVWVNTLIYELQQLTTNKIIISDVRFPNELQAIQKMGGHVIRLTRNPHNDQHESETALDLIEEATINELNSDVLNGMFDAIIDNSKMNVEEQNDAVWRLLEERAWL